MAVITSGDRKSYKIKYIIFVNFKLLLQFLAANKNSLPKCLQLKSCFPCSISTQLICNVHVHAGLWWVVLWKLFSRFIIMHFQNSFERFLMFSEVFQIFPKISRSFSLSILQKNCFIVKICLKMFFKIIQADCTKTIKTF